MADPVTILEHPRDAPGETDPTVGASSTRPASADRLLPAVAILGLLWVGFRIWWPMFTDTFRLDENLTGWVIGEGLGESIARSWRYQGQSPLYFAVLWLWQSLVGSEEWVLRLPSVVATLAAAWHLRRFAADVDRRTTGTAAAGVFLVLELVSDNATSARPYAFLLLALVIAARAGLSWSRSGRWLHALGWVVASVVAVYMQPFAVYALVPHMVWVRRRLVTGAWQQVLGSGLLGVALVAPLVPQVMSLASRQENLVLVAVPPVWAFLPAAFPVALIVGGVAGMIVSRGTLSTRPADESAWVFALAWAIVPPLGLVVQSHLTGNGVFSSRYFAGAAPGIALVAGMVIARMATRPGAVVALAVTVVAAILPAAPMWAHEWDLATDALNREPPDAAVLTMTGFVEASDSVFLEDREASEYVNAPLRYYGVERPVTALPMNLEGANDAYVDRVVSEAAARHDRIVVLEATTRERDYRDVVPERLAGDGYEVTSTSDYLGLRLTVIERRRP